MDFPVVTCFPMDFPVDFPASTSPLGPRHGGFVLAPSACEVQSFR